MWAPDENRCCHRKKNNLLNYKSSISCWELLLSTLCRKNSLIFLCHWDTREWRSNFWCPLLGVPFACLSDFVSTWYAHGIFTHNKLQLLFLPTLLYPGLGQKPTSYADKTVCGLRPPLFWKSYFNLDCYTGLQHSSTNNKCQQNWAKTALPDKLRNDRLGLRPALQQEPPRCCTTGPLSANCLIHLRKIAWCYKWPNKH